MALFQAPLNSRLRLRDWERASSAIEIAKTASRRRRRPSFNRAISCGLTRHFPPVVPVLLYFLRRRKRKEAFLSLMISGQKVTASLGSVQKNRYKCWTACCVKCSTMSQAASITYCLHSRGWRCNERHILLILHEFSSFLLITDCQEPSNSLWLCLLARQFSEPLKNFHSLRMKTWQ